MPQPTPPPAGGDAALDRALHELPAPILVLSTRVGRGMYSLGEAVVERLGDVEVHHRAVEEFLPPAALAEDLRRYRLISSHAPILLHVAYRLPLVYRRKLWRERSVSRTDLGALRAAISALGVRSVLAVSHRPAFWAALLRERETLDVRLAGMLGEYGTSLGWRYLPWPQLDAFLSPLPRADLRLPIPESTQSWHIALPARRAFAELCATPGDPRTVLLVCGIWGQGRLQRPIRRLLRARSDLTLHAVCGENDAMRRRLSAEFGATGRVHCHAAVDDLAPLMRRCASVVTKPGIATLVEAHAAGRKIFLLPGMPVAEDHNDRYARAHFDAEPFDPARFCRWLAAAGPTAPASGAEPLDLG